MDIFACFGQKKNVYRTFVGRHGAFIMAIEIEQDATAQITGSDGPPKCGSGGAPVSGLFFQSPPGHRETLPIFCAAAPRKSLPKSFTRPPGDRLAVA
jgi:hypothetical protein